MICLSWPSVKVIHEGFEFCFWLPVRLDQETEARMKKSWAMDTLNCLQLQEVVFFETRSRYLAQEAIISFLSQVHGLCCPQKARLLPGYLEPLLLCR
jgi:hypothetical protein